MNTTQRITTEWIERSGLEGEHLLLEGLLRRGFLALRDSQGVWLGKGTDVQDLKVLRCLKELNVQSMAGHDDKVARVNCESAKDAALAVVALPENHIEAEAFSSWTGFDIPDFRGADPHNWGQYRRMKWGARVPTCPAREANFDRPLAPEALDLGVALLVRTFPLARVATSLSCDGHGVRPAFVDFFYDWDAQWGRAVFEALGRFTPNSDWEWREHRLEISSPGGFADGEILGVLNDIQTFARRLLDQNTIDKIGRARRRTLDAFGETPPDVESFAAEAQRQLAAEFDYPRGWSFAEEASRARRG